VAKKVNVSVRSWDCQMKQRSAAGTRGRVIRLGDDYINASWERIYSDLLCTLEWLEKKHESSAAMGRALYRRGMGIHVFAPTNYSI
jgi:hypothetical protein